MRDEVMKRLAEEMTADEVYEFYTELIDDPEATQEEITSVWNYYIDKEIQEGNIGMLISEGLDYIGPRKETNELLTKGAEISNQEQEVLDQTYNNKEWRLAHPEETVLAGMGEQLARDIEELKK